MIDETYQVEKLIGFGGSSKVYLVSDQFDTKYAMKVVRQDKGYTEKFSEKIVFREYFVMDRLSLHPNILKCYAWVQEGFIRSESGSLPIMYNLLEYCPNGTLSNLLKSTGKLTEEVSRFMFRQVAHAIEYMHSQEIAHLDIKHENILLDEFFNWKIADLGSALVLHKNKGLVPETRGTASYMAPEVIDNLTAYNGYKADVYSLGITLFVMLTGCFPNDYRRRDESTSDTDIATNASPTAERAYQFDQDYGYLSPEWVHLLDSMLHYNPRKRISMYEVLQHPWVVQPDSEYLPNLMYEQLSKSKDCEGLSFEDY